MFLKIRRSLILKLLLGLILWSSVRIYLFNEANNDIQPGKSQKVDFFTEEVKKQLFLNKVFNRSVEINTNQLEKAEGDLKNASLMSDVTKEMTKILESALNEPPKVTQIYTYYNTRRTDHATGPGEMGKPVTLPKNLSPEERKAVSEGWLKNACNQYVSDLISVRRRLPDIRDDWCKEPGRFLSDLPETTVVICFHNEAWSILLRTVHSVLDQSPPHLLKQIILVDDFSNMTHLRKPLEDYMSALDSKIRIVRATRREGLIRARLLGFKHVTTPTVTFLDSHCECIQGWLEPLLDRIARNSTTVVFPAIPTISDDTFELQYSTGVQSVGAFNWFLEFIWIPQPIREMARHKHTAEPVRSPTMPGGLFAINTKFFEVLGTYDPGLEIWGGENLELSFKTWMCGGTLELVPCSQVGHIYKRRFTYTWNEQTNVVKKNLVRMAEVWMDDYAKHYYRLIGYAKDRTLDVKSRKMLRRDLQCHDFDWYMENVYPEMAIHNSSAANGEIRNREFKNLCLDIGMRPTDIEPSMASPFPCHHSGGNQYWFYSQQGELKKDMVLCLSYTERDHDVWLRTCHGRMDDQLWLYDEESTLLMHHTRKCLAISLKKDRIVMEFCNPRNRRQQWVLENFRATRLHPTLTKRS